MAEAATVLQLMQFSGQVLSCCYDYISRAKSAPKEIQNAIDETTSLKGLLERLQSIANNPQDDRFVILKSLDRPSGPFQACSEALQELDGKLRSLTQASDVRRRLQWPLEAHGIEKILERLGSHKQDFYLALAGDMALHHESTHEAVVEIKDTVEAMQTAKERDKILDWLSGPDSSINFKNAKSKREPGTCSWLIDSNSFKSWVETEKQVMWLHGLPGTGKTVLSATVVDYLESIPLSSVCSVLYYFFDFSNASQQTYVGFLQCLIRQICSKHNSAPVELVTLHAECRGAPPSSDQLLNTLKALLQKQGRTFIVVDALDECLDMEEMCERAPVLEALSAINALAPARLSIFIASRPEADIKRVLEQICDIDINVQSAVIDEDIRCHIRSCLAKDARLKRWPQSIKDEIETELMKDSCGMFRWVVCQLAELRKCLKPANIRKALKNLPKTLDATYSRILNNVPDMFHSEMRTVLMLLAFSARPMTIQEIAEATAVNLEDGVFLTDNRFGHAYDLLEFCSSLVSLSDVEISPNSPLWTEGVYRYGSVPKDVKLLQFSHFSVKEYILSSRTQSAIPGELLIDERLAHGQLTQACLIYLLDFNGGNRMARRDFSDFPFLPYSAMHWTNHMEHASPEDMQSIDKLLVRLFDPIEENHLMNFLNVYDPNRRIRFFGNRNELSMGVLARNKNDFRPPIHYASLYGLDDIVLFLLKALSGDRNRVEKINSGLEGAAKGGHAKLIKVLLDAGGDPSTQLCSDLLSAAVEGGNPRAVEMLIAANSQVCPGKSHSGSALHLACKEGHADIVQLLLDYGFDPYERCLGIGTPLSSAVRHKQLDVVKTLLRNNVDVNLPPQGYYYSLNLAAKNADVDCVSLLLERGARIEPGSAALGSALQQGNMEMAKVLLKHGADINGVSDGFYDTPLKGAIESQDPEVLEFVLKNGADINSPGGSEFYPVDLGIFSGNLAAADRLLELGAQFGPGALHEALDFSTKEYLAKILLDRGANPNAEDERYGSVLQYAALKSSPTAVKWLLDAGADPNDIPGGEYGTPLQAATYREKEAIISLLLNYGAAVNPEILCGCYGDPLRAAISNADENTVNLFLDRGAIIDRVGEGFTPPLQIAAKRGLDAVLHVLVERDADVNGTGGEYGSALRAALANNHENAARYLLEHGAKLSTERVAEHTTNINSIAIESYKSELEIAAATANTNLIQLLLDHGLDLNTSGSACSRALMRAAQIPDIVMLKFLIEKGANVKDYGGLAMALDPHRAIEDRLEKTQLLLQHGADINGAEGMNYSPVLCAVMTLQECHELLDFLLDRGSDPNHKGTGLQGCALNEAINIGDAIVARKLLAHGADPNLQAGYWGQPLTVAAMKGDEEMFHLLLDHGAEVSPEPYGSVGTPLHAALSEGYYAMAQELIDRGANIHTPSRHASVLTSCCSNQGLGQMDMFHHLLSVGADVNAIDQPRKVDKEKPGSPFYLTPLQGAVYYDRKDLAEILLQHGAVLNPETPEGTYGNPLQAAVKNGYEQLAKFLIDRGANINAIGGKYGTALQAAAADFLVSPTMATMLLDYRPDVSLEGGYYGSALQAAARWEKTQLVKTLLELGAPVNINVGKYGNPLAAATKRAYKDVVKLLIDAGADVNLVGGKYGSPLQAACCARGSDAKSHAVDIIRLLLEKGADVNAGASGKYGTALQAAAYHDRKYVDVLLEHGADPNMRGGKFGSPLKAAKEQKLFRVVKALLDHGATE